MTSDESSAYEELSQGHDPAIATSAAGAGTAAPAATPPQRGRLLGIGSLVVALLAGGAVYAAARSGDQGPQPESVLPRTAFVFVKVDLEPEGPQAAAVGAFTARFPSASAKTAAELRTRVLTALSKSLEVDYVAGVQPWLGRRAAIAAFPTAGGKPEIVAAVQVTDVKAATAALSALKTPPAVSVNGEYLLLAKDAPTLAAAAAATGDEPLEEDSDFSADTARLEGDQIGVLWADNARAAEAAFFGMDKVMGGMADVFGQQLKKVRAASVGRTVMGLHASSTYAELVGVTIDRGGKGAGSAPTSMLTLPDNTIAAGHVADGAALIPEGGFGFFGVLGIVESLSPLVGLSSMATLGLGVGGGDTMSASGSATACAVPAPAYGEPEPTCEAAATFPAASYSASPAASQPAPTSAPSRPAPITPPNPASTTNPQPPSVEEPLLPPQPRFEFPVDGETEAHQPYEDPMAPLMKAFGGALSGAATVALGSLPAPGTKLAPDLALIAAVSDSSKAEAAAAAAKAQFSKAFTDTPFSAVSGGVLTMASDSEYAAKLGTGGLGKTELFQAAMGDLPATVELAIFVNLELVRGNVPGYSKEWLPVSAVGISSTRDGADTMMRIRMVSR